jgi:hypothetical protein
VVHGVRYTVLLLRPCGRAFARGLGVGKDPTTAKVEQPSKGVAGREYAHRRYLLRQAWVDLRHVLVQVWRDGKKAIKDHWEKLHVHHPAQPQANPPTPERTKLRRTAVVGLALGTGVAGMVVIVLAVALAATLGVLYLGEYVVVFALGAVDTGVQRVRGVTMTCRNCGHRITKAEYTCPGGCKTRHHNLRPGRYGVLRRTCGCGCRLPALALLKSYDLESWCPHCEKQLAKGTGMTGEIVIPLFGAPSAGKSQLITVLTVAVETMVDRLGGNFEFADDQTKGDATKAWRGLITTGRSEKTTLVAGATTVPAFSMYVRPRRGRTKLLHVFDAQGEIFNQAEKVRQLKYLEVARTYVFVLDPLSIDRLWAGIEESSRERLHGIRARQNPHKAFEQTLMAVVDKGIDLGQVHLVVALSKADLIGDVLRGVDVNDDGSIRSWLVDELRQGNLVRAMDNHFKEVSFFLTSAVATGNGTTDNSVETFIEQTLAAEGLRL